MSTMLLVNGTTYPFALNGSKIEGKAVIADGVSVAATFALVKGVLSGQIEIKNDSAVTAVFDADVRVPHIAFGGLRLSGAATFFAQTNFDGGEMKSEPPELWSATIDGAAAVHLLPHPFSMGTTGSGTMQTPHPFGVPEPIVGPESSSHVGVRVRLSLTSGDRAVITSAVKVRSVGDITGDGVVDGADLARVLGVWNQKGQGIAADVNHDGVVNGADLAQVLGAWSGQDDEG